MFWISDRRSDINWGFRNIFYFKILFQTLNLVHSYILKSRYQKEEIQTNLQCSLILVPFSKQKFAKVSRHFAIMIVFVYSVVVTLFFSDCFYRMTSSQAIILLWKTIPSFLLFYFAFSSVSHIFVERIFLSFLKRLLCSCNIYDTRPI